ncbi:glycoside hydrolase family protein [Flavobacterium sp.]|jgi:lysozyme|uniref:glycoside hydrolase family protein n=1 Tax=Flavobacterium sp. TaxID=239 RepID=UPI0037C121BC
MAIERRHVAALSVSAVMAVSLWVAEGYTDKAIIPVQGDRPTNGFGSTFRADGTPVQMGDKTNPVEALQRSLAHIQKDENGLKRCVKAPLSQVEYDLMVDFSYQYGVYRLCNSSMVRKANAGDYAGSCKGYLEYKKVQGYDCSTPGNKRCWGVWERSLNRYNDCMEAQQ